MTSDGLTHQVRSDPASSRRAALRRSLTRLEALSSRLHSRLGRAPACAPACNPAQAAETAGAQANETAGIAPPIRLLPNLGPLIQIPQPLARVLIGLLRRHRGAATRPPSPRLDVCLAELIQACRSEAKAGLSEHVSLGGDGGGVNGAVEPPVVSLPVAAVRAILAWRVAGPLLDELLEDLLLHNSTGGADAGTATRGALPSRSALRERWVRAHAPFYTGGRRPRGEDCVSFRRAQLPPLPATTTSLRFAAALNAAEQGQQAAVTAWLESSEGSVDMRGGHGPSTLLMRASFAGAISLVELLLLVWHASPDVQDDSGVSALHLAAARGDVALVQCLLHSGATIDVCDTLGADAEAWAVSGGHAQCAALLRGQRFEPLVLRGILNEIEISSLLSIREAVSAETKCFMDHQDSHEVIFVHSDEARAAVKRSGSEPLIARIISTMRRADPRAQLGDDGIRLSVRCCELHTYRVGGELMATGHRDAGSSITMSVLLSEPSQVAGGTFLTWAPGTEGAEAVEHALGRGDAILFRSEDFHNVSPVRAGVRQSLVVELWTGAANCHDRNR